MSNIIEENNENDFIEKVKDFQDNYYSKNKKNMIFKNKQKLDCANAVCSNFSIDYLISQTIYIIPNTNKIFVDYTVFKLFANTDNFSTIVDNIFILLKNRVESFNNFELHINLDTFTISALERYKIVIKDFIDKCISYNTKYTENMNNLYIYNIPKTFDAIIKTLKPFIDIKIYDKIIHCDDTTSEEVIKLFYFHRDKN